jgi:hypothetical protein
MQRLRFRPARERLKSPNFGVPDVVKRRIDILCKARPYWVHERPGIVEFLSTLKADLVRPFLNGEHTAQPAVVATPKNELENPK